MTTSVAADPRPRLGLQIRTYAYWVAVVLILGLAAVWLGWKLITETELVFSSMVAGLGNGALYALIALGYTLVYGIIELINFAHGDLFMLGTLFSGFMLVTVLSQTITQVTIVGWLAFVLALIATAAFCAGINVTIEFLAYRRLRRAPKLAPLITAVGVSFILQWVGLKWNGSMQKSGWPSLLPQGSLTVAGVEIPYRFFVVLAVTIPVLLLLSWIVAKTRAGKAMRATAQDQDAARLMGINVNRTISFTFAVGGALAGIAGVMYQQTIGTTRYDLGFQLGLVAFTAAVLGGIGNLQGAVLGGVLIGVIQGLNDGVGLGQKYSATVVFTILILVMVFRPSGLLGSTVGEKV